MKNILLPFLRFFSIVIILVSFPIAFSFGLMAVPLAGVYWILTGKSLNPVKIIENCSNRLEVWTTNLLKKFSAKELPF